MNKFTISLGKKSCIHKNYIVVLRKSKNSWIYLFIYFSSIRVSNMRTPTETLKQSTAMERVLQNSFLYECKRSVTLTLVFWSTGAVVDW